MSTALSKAEQNALSVSYEVMGVDVVLDLDFVKRYLVRGQADRVTNQELVFFMNTCKMQKLNPLVAGEAYCIKFGNEPAQLVVGKGAYMRRAYEHPDYLFKEDGIVVQRGHDIIQKEGCCVYPGENLIGGWCRVHFKRNGAERTAFKEVAFEEYNKGQANWKSKPATMINKVAISQCVREAFPKDYEGLYSEDEMIASGAIPADGASGAAEIIYGSISETEEDNDQDTRAEDNNSSEEVDEEAVVSQEQRQALFNVAREHLGADANSILKGIIMNYGYSSTIGMPVSVFNKVMQEIMQIAQDSAESEQVESNEDYEYGYEEYPEE